MGRRGWEIAFYTFCAMVAAAVLAPTYAVGVRYCSGAVDEVCGREWLSAASGYFATLVAAVTIYFLWRQIRQADEHHRADIQREARHIAEMVTIDLLETVRRVLAAEKEKNFDFAPPPSEVSRQLLASTVKVNPTLAIALQKHCAEIAEFSKRASRKFAGESELPAPHTFRMKEIAFRTQVLAHCYAVASAQIAAAGEATGPFITAENLDTAVRTFGVGASDYGYLDYVFKMSSAS